MLIILSFVADGVLSSGLIAGSCRDYNVYVGYSLIIKGSRCDAEHDPSPVNNVNEACVEKHTASFTGLSSVVLVLLGIGH